MFMKKFLFFLTLAIAAMSLSAAPVDQVTAQQTAKRFLTNQLYAGRVMAANAINPVLVKTIVGEGKVTQPSLYIYNTSETYIVVAGDDRAEQILAYGDRPLDINRIPDGLQALFNQYTEEIQFLLDRPGLTVNSIVAPNNDRSLKATNVSPLLTCNWDQEAPYNNQCKINGYSCYTGCPATSAAMVAYYWKYPTTAVSVPGYRCYLSTSYYGGSYVNVAALPSRTFDWANMKDSYTGSYTSAQGDAVAWLMRYVGQAEHMEYGNANAGGSGISVDSCILIANMYKRFGYDNNVRVVKKTSAYSGGQTLYSDTEWANLIQTELTAGRPIVFCAVDPNNGGHAFNVDGYRTSDNKYHINFGWSGSGNGYCALNSFGYSGYTFKNYQQMIIGIQPPGGGTPTPQLSVNPTSLSMSTEVGQTVTKTFTVNGNNLTNNVSVSISGNSAFSVSPTSVSVSDATNGKVITVTYTPTATGTHTATVTCASTGASSVTVNVTGTATAPAATINVNPSTLSFSGTAGETVTKTFTVTGTNLSSYLTLTLNDANGVYSITPSRITASQAANGATVTVTYNPTAAGTNNATITISGGGATSKTVTLNGTATAPTPTVTVNPSTLSFTGVVGETYTKTFTVTGANLTGNLTLTLNNANGIYSITPTRITPTQAASGATVTVTYTPTAAGTKNASVTISGGGATSKTVNLNGTATAPARYITVNPTSLSMNTVVGESTTKTFTVTGTNLTGSLSLAVSGGNGAFSVSPTTITASQAASGRTVTVTYNPQTFGTNNATVTISGGGADAVTVTLNGQADLVKYAPVMLPADENYIHLTGFRADWTDQSPANSVASYTLELNRKGGVTPPDDPDDPENPEVKQVAYADFSGVSKVTGESGLPNQIDNYTNYLPAGWTAENGLWVNDGYIISGDGCSISTPTLDLTGYSVVTVEFTAKSYYPSYYGAAGVTISTSLQTASGTLETDDEWYSYYCTLDCAQSDKVTITGTANYFAIQDITVYAGDNTGNYQLLFKASRLNANDPGGEDYRLITEITPDKFYNVENLTAGGTYEYRVKSVYADGTESEWSNLEEVTLFDAEPAHGYEVGDADHDGAITPADISVLINYLLNGDEVCPICADVNCDGTITPADISALINILLNGGTANMNAKKPVPMFLMCE